MIYHRSELERIEDEVLAPYALKSARSQGRVFEESPSKTRTTFQRDRDRIIHTRAFRRLEYKTQVFVYYEGDHYRTRLTHTMEVAQIGRALARGLGVNPDLTEAICLAHDLGHSPFGHAGEFALNDLMVDHGGFNHNAQSYRVVTKLEERYPNFPGLNLSYETREGIIKHETDYDHVGNDQDYAPGKRASVEAQIANMADEAAYNAHDLDDGLRAEMLDLGKLETLEIWQILRDGIGWQDGPFTDGRRHEMIRELVGLEVTDMVTATHARLDGAGLASPEAVQDHGSNVVDYSDELKPKIKELKAYLYDNMYRHYRLMRMQAKARQFISDIFAAYVAEPRMLPSKTQEKLGFRSVERVVCDYIAGMTDRYAMAEWERLFMPNASP